MNESGLQICIGTDPLPAPDFMSVGWGPGAEVPFCPGEGSRVPMALSTSSSAENRWPSSPRRCCCTCCSIVAACCDQREFYALSFPRDTVRLRLELSRLPRMICCVWRRLRGSRRRTARQSPCTVAQ